MQVSPLFFSIQRHLDEVYAEDTAKPVCTPFYSLGNALVSKIPQLGGNILVVSDLGLLTAVLQRLKNQGQTADVTFIANTGKQKEMGQNFDVTVILSGYNESIEVLSRKLVNMKFDVIVGNPPYQPGKNKAAGNRAGSAARIWHKFVEISWNHLENDGYLAFITPPHWRIPSTATRLDPLRVVRNIMRDHEILWLETGCETYFDLTIGIDAYVVAKRSSSGAKTPVKFHKHGDKIIDVDLKRVVLPVTCEDIVFSILGKISAYDGPRIRITQSPNTHEIAARNTNVSREKTDKHNIPMLANIFGGVISDDKLVWSAIEHPLQKLPKVLVPNHGRYISFPVEEGRYGLSIGIAAVPFQTLEEAENFGLWLNSKIAKFFIKAYQDLDHFKFPTYAVELLPKLEGRYTDQDLYVLFGLSSSEIEYIEKVV